MNRPEQIQITRPVRPYGHSAKAHTRPILPTRKIRQKIMISKFFTFLLFVFCFVILPISVRLGVRTKKDLNFRSFFVSARSFRTLQSQALFNHLRSGKRPASVLGQSDTNAFDRSIQTSFWPSGLLSHRILLGSCPQARRRAGAEMSFWNI